MLIDEICNYLPSFSVLSSKDRAEVGYLSYSQKVEKGEMLLDTKRPGCDNIVIVRSGRLKVISEKSYGNTITLYYLNEADVCLLAASYYLYSTAVSIRIYADRDSEIIKIPVRLYKDIELRYPDVASYSRRLFADRFSDILYVLSSKAFKKDEEYLREYLFEEAAQNDEGIIEKTQEEIGRETAISHSQISTILNSLAKKGVLSMERGIIRIIDRGGLV